MNNVDMTNYALNLASLPAPVPYAPVAPVKYDHWGPLKEVVKSVQPTPNYTFPPEAWGPLKEVVKSVQPTPNYAFPPEAEPVWKQLKAEGDNAVSRQNMEAMEQLERTRRRIIAEQQKLAAIQHTIRTAPKPAEPAPVVFKTRSPRAFNFA